jgi:arginine/lysine/ornithine decarboxylase
MRSPEDSIGYVAREFVYAYPPGIPYIAPGETIEAATIETLREMEESGIRLISTKHQYPHYIETCD